MKRWLPWLKLVAGVALFVFVLSRMNWPAVTGRVADCWQGLLGFGSLAVIFFLVAFCITLWRWHVLLHAFEVPHRLADTVRLGWIGLLFSQVMFGATGGDLVKGYYIARESPHRRAAAVLSVILDRVIGLTALMLLAAIAFGTHWQQVRDSAQLQWLAGSVAVLTALMLGGGALLAWRNFWQQAWLRRIQERLPGRRYLAALVQALWTLRGKRKLLVLSLLMSLCNHGLLVLVCVLFTRALTGVYPSLGTYFFLVPVGLLVNALPGAPGGLGQGEFAFELLFTGVGLTGLGLAAADLGLEAGELGALVFLLLRVTTILVSSVGVYFYVRGKKELRAAVAEAEEQGIQELTPTAAEAP